MSQSDFHQLLPQQIRQAVRTVLERVMQEELSLFLGAARFERSQERQGQPNGYRQRDLNTAVGPIQDLQVPRDPARAFQTQVFERFERNDTAVSEAIAQLWVGGVSQAKVAAGCLSSPMWKRPVVTWRRSSYVTSEIIPKPSVV